MQDHPIQRLVSGRALHGLGEAQPQVGLLDTFPTICRSISEPSNGNRPRSRKNSSNTAKLSRLARPLAAIRRDRPPVEQPITGDELRAIKRYLATRSDRLPWLFVSERSQARTRQSVNYLVAAGATHAGLPPVHPHILPHFCAFALANPGYDLRLIQDDLGHRDPRHTVLYALIAGCRFEGIWSCAARTRQAPPK